jgi:hypothetical protein
MLVGGASALAGDMARVWYRAVTDGLLLIRRHRPIGEPAAMHSLALAGASTLDGIAGAGRIVHALSEAGIRCESVRQLVVETSTEPESFASLDLGARFDLVVLGSHLVNLPEDSRRAAFVSVAARHVADSGGLIIEHHPVDWAETAADVEPTPGAALGMEDVRRDPPFVSAVSVYDIGGRVERQPFTARVLSEDELATELSTVGFAVARRLAPTFVEARRSRLASGAWPQPSTRHAPAVVRALDTQDLRSGHDECKGRRT